MPAAKEIQYTSAEIETIRRMRAEKRPAKQIARELGRPLKGVKSKATEVARLYRRRPEEINAALSARRSVTTDAAIARKLGCATSTVAYYRRRRGMKCRGRGATRGQMLKVARQIRDRDLARCYAEGWPVGCTSAVAGALELIERGFDTTAAMVEQTGITVDTIQKYLRTAKRAGWVTGRGNNWAGWRYTLAPAVVARRRREGVVACIGCHKVGPNPMAIKKHGWRTRTVILGGGKESEVSCPKCFAEFGWGELEGGAA